MKLADKDKVYTGPRARALLRMAEGSAVKLGENAVLGVDDLQEKQGTSARKLVTASLDVARGAFRFTTDIFSKRRAERDVKIRIATVTAGIRGTDLWGKSDAKRDLVCLIEGRIEVTRESDAPVTLDQPLDFYVAPRDGTPPTKAKVDQRQLDEWSAETELGTVSGGARRGGRYRVEVSAASDQKTALADYDKAREAGYPALVQPVKKEGAEEYRVRIVNIASQKDARAVVEKLRALGLAQAAVSK